MFRFDNICIPMRELLYSHYVSHVSSLFFTEVYIKAHVRFDEQFPPIRNMEQARAYSLTFRTYSFEKRYWFKANHKLDECLLILIREELLDE